MSDHDVAVVIPVHNGARYLGEALDSVLDQTLPPAEVVVVDDGSTDETAAVLQRYGDAIRVLTQAHAGYAAAVNRGVVATAAPLLAFQDADDLALRSKFEVLVGELHRDPGLDAVFGAVVQFVSPDLAPSVRKSFVFDPAPTIVELPTTGLVRRDRWELLDGLDVSIQTASNVDWFARMLTEKVQVGHVDTVVYHRRLHETNIGVRERDQKHADLLNIVRSHLLRGRAVVTDAHE